MESQGELRSRLRRISDRVRWLMEEKPQTRGDDRILILEYFKYFEPIFVYDKMTETINLDHPLSYDEFRRLTSFETIRRTRQKLQEEHPELLPTDKTILKRSIRSEQFREIMGKNELDDSDLVDYYE